MCQNGGIWYPTNCWWPRTSGEKNKPGKMSKSCRQRMDDIPFIFQQQALNSQLGVMHTVKLSAMEKVRCSVYCTFKRSWSHGPVIKPNQTILYPIFPPFLKTTDNTSISDDRKNVNWNASRLPILCFISLVLGHFVGAKENLAGDSISLAVWKKTPTPVRQDFVLCRANVLVLL